MAKVTTELLIAQADIYGIEVETETLPDGLLGKANAEIKTITMNTSIEHISRLYKCVLAEEIGHILYPPRPGHVRYHSTGFVNLHFNQRGNTKIIVAQDERKALDWATSILIPDVEFDRIMEAGNYTIWEITERFDVERWLVDHKIGRYRRKEMDQGRKVKWRDIIKRSI